METTESAGLLDKILPPRLEDAGLEDCALPPDSIHEAFLKAASAVKSRAVTFFHSGDEDEVEHGCLDDPLPENGKCSSDILVSPPCPDTSDVLLVGGSPDPASESAGGCVKEKGSGIETVEGKDMVVVGGDVGDGFDGIGKGCCLDDQLKGLKIGEKEKKKIENEEKEEEEEKGNKKPTLVEGFV